MLHLIARDGDGDGFNVLHSGLILNIMPENQFNRRLQEVYAPRDIKIPHRLGGGVLKERVIRDLSSRRVISYALAYINPLIYAGDNGRVLGYDNSHGFSHRHFCGEMTADVFTSYEDLYDRFEKEWQSIAMDYVNGALK